MASTYTPIATATASGSTNNVTFSSIPSTYTDLVAVINVKLSATGTCWSYLNADASSGLYSDTVLIGNGSTASSFRNTAQNALIIAESSSIGSTNFATIIVHYMNYSNSNTFKTVISRNASPDFQTSATVNLWRNTTAVNTINFNTFGAPNFAAGSTFTLYGIKAA